MSHTLAPIVVFAYNRPWHLQQTIEALLKNDLAAKSDIHIFSDGPRSDADIPKIEELRKYIKSVQGFKRLNIYEREKNMGLANSIITGVTEVISTHEQVIVMEDDLLCSSDFLAFMNQGIDTYKNQPEIFSITGWKPPIDLKSYHQQVYLHYRPSSLGWATWKESWATAKWDIPDYESFRKDKAKQKLFQRGGADLPAMLSKQMNGKIDSWAIRWAYTLYKENAFCVYPTQTKIRHIGFDGSGSNNINKKMTGFEDFVVEGSYEMPQGIKLEDEPVRLHNGIFEPSLIRKTINYFKQLTNS